MKDEALRLALEALLEHGRPFLRHEKQYDHAITAIKQALEQPEPEPVAWKDRTYGNLHHQDFGNSIPLYTSPPKREWQGLTDDEIWKFWWSRPEVSYGEDDSMEAEFVVAVRRILAAHGIKEKNT